MLRVHLKYPSHGDFLISIPRAYHEHTFLNNLSFFFAYFEFRVTKRGVFSSGGMARVGKGFNFFFFCRFGCVKRLLCAFFLFFFFNENAFFLIIIIIIISCVSSSSNNNKNRFIRRWCW